jgi:hypothetical protein
VICATQTRHAGNFSNDFKAREPIFNRLIMMAREYTVKGDALAGQSGADPPPGADRRASAESGREEAALPPAPNGADSAADC